MNPYRPFAAVSLLEYGGLKPILPFHGVRSDAACRVVVKRMCEEHFNHALPVLGLMRFFCREASAAFFCPWRVPAGWRAFGRGPVRATPAMPVCGLRGRAGVARRRQKPCVVARGELSFPPFFGNPKKGGAGAAGARSPRGKAWAFLRLALRPWQNLHEQFGTVRAGTRGWAGNSRPAPTSTAPTKIAIVISLMGRNGISHIKRRGTPRRYGLREMELLD